MVISCGQQEQSFRVFVSSFAVVHSHSKAALTKYDLATLTDEEIRELGKFYHIPHSQSLRRHQLVIELRRKGVGI